MLLIIGLLNAQSQGNTLYHLLRAHIRVRHHIYIQSERLFPKVNLRHHTFLSRDLGVLVA